MRPNGVTASPDQVAAFARLLISAMREAVVVTDADGRVTYWNDGAARVFGWSASERVGRPLVERLPEHARADVEAQMRAVLEGAEWHGECEDYRKDGTRVWLNASVRPLQTDEGTIIGVLGIAEDISDRKRSEQALRDSESRLAEAQSAARLGSWTWEPRTGQVWWSSVVYELLGLGPDVVPSLQLFLDMVHPEDRPLMGARSEAIAAGASEIAHDLRIVRPDGSLLWLDSRARAVRDADGTLLRVDGTHQDITERKRTEIEGNAAQAQRDYLWNNSPDPVCTAGFDGYFRQLNPAWMRRLGWTEEELRARPWLDFVHPDDREATMAAGERLRRGDVVYGFVNRYRTRDGTYRWFSWNAIPFPDRQAISAFVRDVTEEERLSEQVRQSQKMEAIGRLAGGVAHDFNNLLTVINGYTALMLGEAPEESPEREALESIRDAGERAASLTAQLLAFSRKAIVEPRPIDLNRAMGSALRLLRRLIGEDIDLLTDFAPDLPIIRIDPGQLEQVVMNLVVNGRDAMPEGGVLHVSTSVVHIDEAADVPPGRYVRLTVTDSGGGMPADVKALVFEPFFTTKPVGKGTGLGLATVYGIVCQAGGTISVESTVGQGSTFHVLFPAHDGGHAREFDDSPATTEALAGHETVLLVEDEDAVGRFAKQTLERQGYLVIPAASAREALSLPPDTLAGVALLITDVIMPEMGGRELADSLRRLYPLMRVLYTSGYTDDADVRGGLASATDAFLQKPFTPQALARKVRLLLDAKP